MRQKKKTSKGITLIRKSNDLIEARYKFDLWELRFFISVLSQIKLEESEFKVYRIWFKDIIKTFQLKSHQSYDLLRESAKSLMAKSFFLKYEDNGKPREMQYHILRKIDYSTLNSEKRDESQEYIDITIEEDMKPYLLQLQKSFTTYDIRNVIKLGVSSFRIYELLKQYESIGVRTIIFDEMKRMFELQNEYKRFPNFNQKVIQPAIRDINKYTDLFVMEVEQIKHGRSVESLKFKFRKKEQYEIDLIRGEVNILQTKIDFNQDENDNKPVKTIEIPNKDYDRLFETMYPKVVENLGVSPITLADLVKKYNENDFLKAIRITQRLKLSGGIKNNISGFFVKALTQGYTDINEETLKKKEKESSKLTEKHNLLKRRLELQKLRNEQINQIIREQVNENPNITLDAIQSIEGNVIYNNLLQNFESKLGRKLEINDYRMNSELIEIVKKTIISLNTKKFVSIFEDIDPQIDLINTQLSLIKN